MNIDLNSLMRGLPSSHPDAIALLKIPGTPKGKQKRVLKIHQLFTASSLAPYRGEFEVVEIYKENGFYRYVCKPKGAKKGRLVFRNKDVLGHEAD